MAAGARRPAAVHAPMRRGSLALAFMLALALLLVPVLSAAWAEDAAAMRLVDRVVEAYGGGRVLGGVRGYRAAGTLRAHARGEDGVVVRISQGARRMKVMIHYPSSVEIRVLDGDEGWKGQRRDDLVPVRGPMVDAMVLQAARIHLPWVLARLRSRVQLVESGAEGPLLQVDLRPGLRVRALLDPDTYRVVRSESRLSSGPMSMEFVTRYSDFRRVDGLLFPFHEETFAGAVHTATVRFEKLQLNPEGDEAKLPSLPPRPGRSPHMASPAAHAAGSPGPGRWAAPRQALCARSSIASTVAGVPMYTTATPGMSVMSSSGL